jgi:hypothetical protein
MREEALELSRRAKDPSDALNRLREYTQALVLRSLHDSQAFLNLAFVGGTALRFLYNLRRFSEDLDFCLVNEDGYDPAVWLRQLKTRLAQGNMDATIRWNGRTNVHKAWIRLPSLLHDAGLSPLREQNLSIKLEIDTRPPVGGHLERSLVERHRILALQHYDRPSLMAGKLHALLCRSYPKGRDWYDLLWYRAQQTPVEPNLILLQNALDQTQGAGAVDASDWKAHLVEKLSTLEIGTLLRDVSPFLEIPDERSLFERETLLAAIRGR